MIPRGSHPNGGVRDNLPAPEVRRFRTIAALPQRSGHGRVIRSRLRSEPQKEAHHVKTPR
jgi:hypothetical protein